MKELHRVVDALTKTNPCEHNELLMEVLPSVPNKFNDCVEIGFNGWRIKLHPNGRWSLESNIN